MGGEGRLVASAMFKGLHFPKSVVLTCVRWYLRYKLSYRDLEEMMPERCVFVDHSTVSDC